MDIDRAGVADKLWHKMRSDFLSFAPELADTELLMCCACGRLLTQEMFSIEHLIPQQALAADPPEVKNNPATPKNVRSGLILLCRSPLKFQGKKFYDNGCNSWKGRYYDHLIKKLTSGDAFRPGRRISQLDIIAAINLGYLAMVSEFGYRVVLMQSGLLMRQQFFSPYHFHQHLPVMSQTILGGQVPVGDSESPIWARPFGFTIEPGKCFIGVRNFSLMLPVSYDPTQPIARHLRIVPSKYIFRPDFTTVFD